MSNQPSTDAVSEGIVANLFLTDCRDDISIMGYFFSRDHVTQLFVFVIAGVVCVLLVTARR